MFVKQSAIFVILFFLFLVFVFLFKMSIIFNCNNVCGDAMRPVHFFERGRGGRESLRETENEDSAVWNCCNNVN